MKKGILFFIESEVQIDRLLPLIKHLRSDTNILFDVIVPTVDNLSVSNAEIFNETARILGQHKILVRRSVAAIGQNRYQILVAPYMYKWLYDGINAKYRLKYYYGETSLNKPNWSIPTIFSEDYRCDGVLLHSSVDAHTESCVATNAFNMPALHLAGYKRSNNSSKKPTLLFAPTYNDFSFAVKFLKSIDDIKRKYKVIMRGHHRSVHIEDTKNDLAKLYDCADDIFDITEHSIKEPLEQADIMISDNSGAIFDAVYCGVPVALFSKGSNTFKYRGINAIQHDFVKRGDILWTNKPDEIVKIADETLTSAMVKRQKKMRAELFPEKFADPIGRWMEVLNIYLNDELPYQYVLAKKYWIEKIDSVIRESEETQQELRQVRSELDAKNAEIASFLSIKRSARLLGGNIKRRMVGRHG